MILFPVHHEMHWAPEYYQGDHNYHCALHVQIDIPDINTARCYGHAECTKLVLEAGADINKSNNVIVCCAVLPLLTSFVWHCAS